MPKKSTKVKTPVVEQEIVVEEPPVVVEESTPTKKIKKSKTKKSAIEVQDEVPELVKTEEVVEQVPVVDEIAQCSEEGVCPVEPSKKKKRVVTKQEIITDLDVVFTEVITSLTDKSLVKKVKQLKSDLVKLFKLRNVNKKEGDNPNSGFRKPVDVSPEMRNFLQLSPSELTRRLDITKKLCDYIKENNLQDQNDRRNILPDATLKQLLSISDTDPPLTYYSIQQKLKPHIIKV